jgi:hypothetical protein
VHVYVAVAVAYEHDDESIVIVGFVDAIVLR